MHNYPLIKFGFNVLGLLLLLGCQQSNNNSNTQEPQTTPSQNQETKSTISDPTADSPIEAIRTEYTRITSLMEQGALRRDSLYFESESDPCNGHLLRYYEGEELVMLNLEKGGEHWWEGRQVYFNNGEPFFVFDKTGGWQFGGPIDKMGNPGTIDKITESRYYLHQDTLIRHLEKAYEIKSWEAKKVNADDIPNEPIRTHLNQPFIDLEEIEQLQQGVAGCE